MAGHRAQIRLWGVDTPEVNQRGYVAAKSALIALADNEVITCQIMHRDKYGRTVARCYLPSGRDIGGELIRRDLARELRHFSKGYYSKRRL
jgi:endonuclease YncB( thermonuclease family)